MANLQPFTADDWAAWSGANRFADDHEPLIGQVGAATMIADQAGITLNWGEHGHYVKLDALGHYGGGPCELTPEEIRTLARELFIALTEEEA